MLICRVIQYKGRELDRGGSQDMRIGKAPMALLSGTQVFVANPNKSAEVVQILTGNKERLLRYLGDFHMDKGARPRLPCIGLEKHHR